jgi:hypothetical protein
MLTCPQRRAEWTRPAGRPGQRRHRRIHFPAPHWPAGIGGRPPRRAWNNRTRCPSVSKGASAPPWATAAGAPFLGRCRHDRDRAIAANPRLGPPPRWRGGQRQCEPTTMSDRFRLVVSYSKCSIPLSYRATIHQQLPVGTYCFRTRIRPKPPGQSVILRRPSGRIKGTRNCWSRGRSL